MLLFAGEHRVTDGWFRVELDINPLYDQREIPRLGPGYQYTPSHRSLFMLISITRAKYDAVLCMLY